MAQLVGMSMGRGDLTSDERAPLKPHLPKVGQRGGRWTNGPAVEVLQVDGLAGIAVTARERTRFDEVVIRRAEWANVPPDVVYYCRRPYAACADLDA
ncbi:hypothetical protein ACFFHJ_37235 [Planotetraspora thailandica]|uniref:hypothetical protein n=1 Tax=Planotetraspora thailandica TaxID=487172 RepID=UPI00194FB2CC|nr:hypothetical protein [Planotetraspora thailandica]